MKRLEEIAKANNELTELGARIEGIKFHLRSLENNIALLNSLRIQHAQNIAILKEEGIIPSIEQYKKIREELNVVRNKLYLMRIDFSNHELALEKTKNFLVECQEKYAILVRSQNDNVVKGNFGGKK